MAHEIETMAWAGEVPWHGLGVKVDNDLTPDQMLKAANLDWRVHKVPSYADYTDSATGEQVRIATGDAALIRSSDRRVLSNISQDWEPVQNEDAFRFFNEFVLAGDMEMHTAGSLKDGQMVWGLAKVRESFTLFGGDKVDSYLLFSNPHEYGKSIDVRFTPIRVVCNNTLTLSLSLKSDQMVRLNHRKPFNAEEVKKMLGIASTKLGTYKQVAELLGSKQYTDKGVKDYFMQVFPTTVAAANDDEEVRMSRPARIAMDALENQPGANYAKNSWWQAFNAVTYTTDHLLGHQPATRLESAWYGANRQRKIMALEKAVKLAEAA